MFLFHRLASNNNLSKSESDQEDNDDLNDNDWSYGAEKKGLWQKMQEWFLQTVICLQVVNILSLFMLQLRKESQIRLVFHISCAC